MKTFNFLLVISIFALTSIFSANNVDAQSPNRVSMMLEGDTYSFQSLNYPDRYIRHRNFLVELTAVSSELDKKDASFKVVKGLWGNETISFESVNYPGYYLRHEGFVLKLHKATPDELFKKDASFKCWQSPIDENKVCFESVNYPS